MKPDVLQAEVQQYCLPVNVRTCQLGEVIGAQGDVCDPCLPGQYSFDPRNATCEAACPANANCSGSVVVPDEGYWHSDAKATLVHQCPNQKACRSTCVAVVSELHLLYSIRCFWLCGHA